MWLIFCYRNCLISVVFDFFIHIVFCVAINVIHFWAPNDLNVEVLWVDKKKKGKNDNELYLDFFIYDVHTIVDLLMEVKKPLKSSFKNIPNAFHLIAFLLGYNDNHARNEIKLSQKMKGKVTKIRKI